MSAPACLDSSAALMCRACLRVPTWTSTTDVDNVLYIMLHFKQQSQAGSGYRGSHKGQKRVEIMVPIGIGVFSPVYFTQSV